jgi:hypothetical protein
MVVGVGVVTLTMAALKAQEVLEAVVMAAPQELLELQTQVVVAVGLATVTAAALAVQAS